MAIKGKFTTLSGVTLDAAYANIPSVGIIKIKQQDGTNQFFADAYVTIYADHAAYAGGKTVIKGESLRFEIDPASADVLGQAYVALKQSGKIEGAVDC